MSSAAMLALVLVAVAGFTVVVVRRRPPAPGALDRDQLLGFVYVGAGAAALLAVAVLVVDVFSPVPDRAASLAVLGLFGYCLYLLTAFIVLTRSARRR